MIFFHQGLLPRGTEQLWMFFLQSAQFWLVPTWYDSHCQGTKWLPWLVKIRIGMLWCNAGRGRAPCWLMATQTERDPWSRVCFTCGWDAVCSGPGNNCGLNLDDTSRMKTQPLSSVISLSSVAHLFVVSWQPPSPRKSFTSLSMFIQLCSVFSCLLLSPSPLLIQLICL